MAWVPFVAVPVLVAINAIAYFCNVNSRPRRWLAGKGKPRCLLAVSNRCVACLGRVFVLVRTLLTRMHEL